MHTQSSNRVRPANGLAFPVHELVFVHSWAHGRGLTMTILLDQVLNGVAFEEMVLIRGRGLPGGALTLWRVAGGGVVVQAKGGVPIVFGGIHTALSHAGALFAAMPARAPSVWRRLLGWRRA